MESKQHKPTNLNQYKMSIYINKPSPRSIPNHTQSNKKNETKPNQTNNTIKKVCVYYPFYHSIKPNKHKNNRFYI